MEELCEGCGALSVSFDPLSGVLACYACGLVRDETQFHQADHDRDGQPLGTFVGGRGTSASTLGARGFSVLRSLGLRTDRKRKYSTDRLSEVVSLLRLPKDKADDVKHLVKVVTEDKWGAGRWMDVLIGACICIVTRQSHLPLSTREIGEAVNCSTKELLRMHKRVLAVMDAQPSNIDPVVYFDRILNNFPAFMELEKDTLAKLLKQGHLLLQCGAKWFLSTGRHPLAVVAAVVLIVATANDVRVELEAVSRDLNVHPQTTKSRLKEFNESLVGAGQSLPWGKDITLKTINRHLPFLLQYLETKMKIQGNSNLVKNVLLRPNKPMEVDNAASTSFSHNTSSFGHLDRTLCSKYERLVEGSLDSHTYVVAEDTDLEAFCTEEETRCPKIRKVDGDTSGQNEGVGEACFCSNAPTMDFESGTNEASSLEKRQPEWEPLPPSFLANKAARATRLVKMEAAKKRIAMVKQEMAKQLGSSELDQESVTGHDEKPSITRSTPEHMKLHSELRGLDAEDLLIEYFLLRGVNEELIRAGRYKVLLSTSPIQPDSEEIIGKDWLQYLRSTTEVEFLNSLDQEEPDYPWLIKADTDL